MAEISAKQQKELLEKMFKEQFLPKWNENFAGDLAEGTPWLERLGHKLYGSEGMARRGFDDFLVRKAAGDANDAALAGTLEYFNKASKTPFSTEKTHVGDIVSKLDDGTSKTFAYNLSPLGESVGGAWNYAKSNPGAVLGTAATTAGSLAGLFDNDKIGGQLIATGLGAAIPAIAGMKLNPLTAYNVAMGAGTLGSLFDTLRAKKAQEQQYSKEEYVR